MGDSHRPSIRTGNDRGINLGRRPFVRGVAATALAGGGLATLARPASAITQPCFDVVSTVALDMEHFLGALYITKPCFDEGIGLALYDDLLELEEPILVSFQTGNAGISDSTVQQALDIGLGVEPVHEGGHLVSDTPGDEEYRFHFPVAGLGLEAGPTTLAIFGAIDPSAGGGYFVHTDDVVVKEEGEE